MRSFVSHSLLCPQFLPHCLCLCVLGSRRTRSALPCPCVRCTFGEIDTKTTLIPGCGFISGAELLNVCFPHESVSTLGTPGVPFAHHCVLNAVPRKEEVLNTPLGGAHAMPLSLPVGASIPGLVRASVLCCLQLHTAFPPPRRLHLRILRYTCQDLPCR